MLMPHSLPSLPLNSALEEESSGTASPNDPDRPQHAAAGVSERRHANAALQGIDLQGHPHTWLSPGIDLDTSEMSARHEPARLLPDPPWKPINQGSTYACRDADCGTHSQVARRESRSPGEAEP